MANGGTISLQGTCDNTGATLTLDGSDGSFLFSGSIIGGTVAETNGAALVPQAGTLDGVTVDGAVTVTTDGYLYVKDGLTLNATLTLGDSNGYYGLVDFEGTQTLDGTGTVVFSGPSSFNSLGLSSGTLTIGSGITVEGQSGYVGYSPSFRGSPALINQGTIDSDVSGSTITVYGTDNQNNGTVEATYGGTIVLQAATFTNTGLIEAGTDSTISVQSSTFNLNNGTLASIGSFIVQSTTVNFNGGIVSTPISLISTTLNIASTAALAASFDLYGTNYLTGNLGVGQALIVEPYSNTYSIPYLYLPDGMKQFRPHRHRPHCHGLCWGNLDQQRWRSHHWRRHLEHHRFNFRQQWHPRSDHAERFLTRKSNLRRSRLPTSLAVV